MDSPPTIDGTPRGRFIVANEFSKLVVENNYLENTSGLYVSRYIGNKSAAQTITIRYNKVKNIDGRHRNNSSSSFVQFVVLDAVQHVKSIEIAWNQIINLPTQSRVEDNINVHKSSGTSDSPILIHDNYIQGAYPVSLSSDFSGSGINLGDGNGTASEVSAWARAYNNQLVSTTNVGVAITAGNNLSFYNNRIIACGKAMVGSSLVSVSGQNVGIAIYNMNSQPSNVYYGNSAKNNTIGFVNLSLPSGRNDKWIQNAEDVGNVSISGSITYQMEQNEYNTWLQKVASNGKTIGLYGSTPPPTTTTPPPSDTQSPTVAGRVEAETGYAKLNDVGSYAIGLYTISTGKAVSIFDPSDKIRLTINASTAGSYIVKARVRSGNVNGSQTYWPNGYSFWVNGVSTVLTGVSSTVSAKEGALGGSYWGTMVSKAVTLKAGANTVDIAAVSSWGAVDYIEIASTTSTSTTSGDVVAVPSTSGKRVEAETYSKLADVGTYSISKVSSSIFSGGASISILDNGDKIRLTFDATAGNYNVKVRVRSGDKTNTTGFFANAYLVQVNGVTTSYTGDRSSISALSDTYGGSYWGNLVTPVVALRGGTNTVDIAATASWGGVDYIEIVPSSSSSRVADIETEEVQDVEYVSDGVVIYPNPVQSSLNLSGLKGAQDVSLSLYHTSGFPIFTDKVTKIYDGTTQLDLDQYQIQNGYYILKVKEGKEVTEHRIFKQ
jgi:hypothetical protein